jgi:hypothetical protein
MVQLAFAFVALTLLQLSVHASPILNKRIDQITMEAVTPWETACRTAGGGEQCNVLIVAAAGTLFAAADNCAQQIAADSFVTLAKTLSNNAEMISLAQIFVQQPRNTPNSLATPYCNQAPVNSELDGLFQCQYEGANLSQFVGGLSVGDAGTIPLNHNGAVTPPGSCPANPAGPIADGSQLGTLTTNPNAPGANGSPPPAAPTSVSGPSPTAVPTSAGSCPTSSATDSAPTPPQSTPNPAASPAPASLATGSFQLANGQAAQKLNAQFATLTADSTCTAGQNSCVGSDFAQCVGGKFVTQSCGATLICAALPLVNSAGTSITCTTQADALARIANTGATGGLTGSG